MKSTTPRLNRLTAIGALFILSLFALAQSSRAAPLYFDAGHDITWDDGIRENWSASAGGPYNERWVDGADAYFEGAGGTVTVDGTIASVNAIVFGATGYSLTGGMITLTGDASITAADYDATIAGSIDGSAAGFLKSGEARLTVSGASSFGSGGAIQTVAVSDGMLRLSQSGLGWSGSGWGDGAPILVSSDAILDVARDFNAGITRAITIDGGTLNFTAGSSSDSNNYANNLTLNNATVTGNRIRLGYGSNALFTVTGTTTIASALQLVRLRADAQGEGQLVLDVDTGALLTVTGGITDRSGLEGLRVVKDGEGTMEVSGASSFTGGVFVEGGTLRLNQSGLSWSNPGGWGNGTPILVSAGATLELAANFNAGMTRSITLDGGTLHISHGSSTDGLNYVNNLTLENGAQVTGNYLRFSAAYNPAVTVGGTAASTIDAGIRMWGGGANQAVFDVANVTGNADADLTVTGAIIDNSGSTAIVKNGGGTLVFAGANTYRGTTAVNAGTLLVDDDSGGATGAVTVAAGATLGGTGTIGGATTLAGGAALSPGAGTGTLTFGNTLTLEDGAVWDWAFVDVRNYGQAAGPNLILPAGAGTNITLNLRGLEGYSVSAGDRFTLFSGQVANFDAGRVTVVNHTDWDAGWQLSEGSLVLTASLAPLYFSAGNSTTWTDDGTTANWSSGPGGPYDQAWLSGRNAHFEGTGGAVTVAGAIASVSSMSFDASGYSLSGGTIHLTGLATVTADYDTTISSSIDGSAAGMVKDGEGRLTVSGASSFGSGDAIQTITVSEGTLRLNQPFDGGDWNGGGWGDWAPIVVATGATLEVAHRHNLGFDRPVTLDGGTLHLTASDPDDSHNYANDLTLNNGAQVTGNFMRFHGNGAPVVTVAGSEASTIHTGIRMWGGGANQAIFDVANVTGSADADLTVTGAIIDNSGSMAIVKNGDGTLVFAGANTYSGATAVNAGTLLVDGDSGGANGAVTVAAGATLGGTGTIGGATTLAGGAALSPGAGTGTLTFGNTLTLEDGAVWDWAFVDVLNYGQAAGPNLVLPAGAETNITLNVRGLEGYSVSAGDRFTLFSGEVANFDAGRVTVVNHTGWDAGWQLSEGSLVLTASLAPLYFSAGNSTTWADDGTTANWSSSAGGPYDQAWLSGRNAHFEGTGGAVTVAGAIASVSSMSFDASGYSLNGGTIHLTGLAIVTANYDTTISSSIDGSAAGMVKDGEGRLTVSGASSFGSGEAIQTITVSEGTLRLNQSGLGWSGSGWGNNAPIVVDSEATLELAGRFNSGHARPITVDGGTLAITTAGSSTDGDNYFNDLTLRNGAVVTGRPFRVGGNVDGMITVGGTEASNIDAGVILVGLTGSTGVAFNVDAATSGSGPDLTISGVIRDYTASQTLDVFKEGPGTLVLSGDNAYTSATTVKAGTLLVNNTSGSGTGSGPVAVRSDATLGGTGAIAGAVTIEEGGTLGTRTGIDSLTFGSTLTLEDGTVWDWAFINNVDGNYDQADGPNLVLPNEGIVTLNIWGLDDHSVGWYDEFTLFTGDVENFDAGLFQLENHSDWTRGWKVSLGNSLVLTAVPEPGAWLLLLSALVSGMLVRRRRR